MPESDLQQVTRQQATSPKQIEWHLSSHPKTSVRTFRWTFPMLLNYQPRMLIEHLLENAVQQCRLPTASGWLRPGKSLAYLLTKMMGRMRRMRRIHGSRGWVPSLGNLWGLWPAPDQWHKEWSMGMDAMVLSILHNYLSEPFCRWPKSHS